MRSAAPSARRPCTRTPSGTPACSRRRRSRGSGRASADWSAPAAASYSGRRFSHQTCAQPRNTRCSGVKPSSVCRAASAGERRQIRHQREPQPAVVGGVLAERQLSVELHIVHRGVAGVLVDEAAARARRRPWHPSGVHQSFRLPCASNCRPWSSKPCVSSWPMTAPAPPKLTAASADRAVEGRLEDAGREVDVVLQRVVVRVDGRRRHAPLGLVERLADLVHLAMELERVGALRVAERVAAHDASARCSRATCPDSRSCPRPRAAWRAPAAAWRRSSTSSVVMSCSSAASMLVHHLQRVGLGLRTERFRRRTPCRAPRRDRRPCTARSASSAAAAPSRPAGRRRRSGSSRRRTPRQHGRASACTSCQRRYVCGCRRSASTPAAASNALKKSGSVTLIA